VGEPSFDGAEGLLILLDLEEVVLAFHDGEINLIFGGGDGDTINLLILLRVVLDHNTFHHFLVLAVF
jgi:hypothetical protein